ncbi:MAG: tetratricopeptide repeat protein [Gemmatimonadota bacterium]
MTRARAGLVAPALLVAVGLLLGLVALRPPGWVVLGLIVLAFVPGRWWRWRTRRFRRGLRALRGGRLERARAELEAFLRDIEADPRFLRVQPWFNLGRPYPYEVAARANLGVVDLRRGHPRRALEHFRTALETEPGWLPARHGEAAALRLVGDGSGAEAAARAVLEARPSYLPARLLLAVLLRERGATEAAERTLTPLREKGKDPEVLIGRLLRQWEETPAS